MTKLSFRQRFGISHSNRQPKDWRRAAAVASLNIERRSDCIPVLLGIRYRQKLDILDGLAGQQAQSGPLVETWLTVERLWYQNAVDVSADIIEGRAHHRELREEIVITGRRNPGQCLNRAKRIVGQDRRGLANLRTCKVEFGDRW